MLPSMPPIESSIIPVESHRADDYAAVARSANTLRAYRFDLQCFVAYCQGRALTPLPATAATISAYLAFLADQGKKVSTLERRLAAISQAHKHAGLTTPTQDGHVHSVLKGIRRTHGCAPAVKAPILVEDLRAMIAALPDHKRSLRDRALLLIGFAGGFPLQPSCLLMDRRTRQPLRPSSGGCPCPSADAASRCV